MKKILIIEDEEAIIDALTLILNDKGFDVDSTSDAGKSYEKIESFNPDLILLDMLLSGYDGRKICASLKNSDKTKDIPIIMVSAHPSAEKNSLESGANAFIPKPFGVDELMENINKYIN